MSKSSVIEPGVPYMLCVRCKHVRPRTALAEVAGQAVLVCGESVVCDSLLLKVPGPMAQQIERLDWDRMPDPPLVSGTVFHKKKHGELASVTAYSNGHNVGGNGK